MTYGRSGFMACIKVGSLVSSRSSFEGVAKVISIDVKLQKAKVGFFYTPNARYENVVEVHASDLIAVETLQNQTIIFCLVGSKPRWLLGFYEGNRPNNQHLVKFTKEYSDVFDIEDIYVPTLFGHDFFEPHEFLKANATVSPFLTEARAKFNQCYLSQRASCQSMASFLGSAVEFEGHQLAVVSRVLSDSKRKYLLCDEVGLGKTIEAGLIIRHHIMERGRDARVFILTPSALTLQWKREMTERFHLSDVLALSDDELDPEDDTQLVYLGAYRDIIRFREKLGKPTMIVVDEAHQFAQLGWSDQFVERFCFDTLAEVSSQAEVSLMLTGTPLIGQEKNYLAMLHCLERDKYSLDEAYLETFKSQIMLQSQYVGLYRALDPAKDNDILEGVLEDIEALDLGDETLQKLSDKTKPLVDFFADEDEIDACERANAVLAVRNYFGEHYTLNYRMLRNRRDSSNGAADKSSIQYLFPGLGKCEFITWDLPVCETLQDQQLDDLRSVASISDQTFSGNLFGLEENQYLSWLEALMLSPSYLAMKVNKLLKTHCMGVEQQVYWHGLLEVADAEQQAKDSALLRYVEHWLLDHPKGKVVVFCGDCGVADHVYQVLSHQLKDKVERHNTESPLRFIDDESVRVLVCDERGEDGLNLQGRQRLAVHYSLPLAVNRIEQRNGRLNRYSAFSKGCSPIETCVLVPKRDGFYRQWAELLRDGIGAFEHYRASIQEPIDSFLSQGWSGLWQRGFAHLSELADTFSGPQGLVARELKKLDIQDAMDRDMLDVRAAINFSKRINEEDKEFEQVSTDLLDWIVHGLLFEKSRVENTEQYKLQFIHHRTRLNVDNLIRYCIIGLDFEHSTFRAPVTYPMSADRTLCAKTGAYPLRFGQPFVDSIAMMSEKLPLGLASAYLRKVNAKLGGTQLCFKTQWMVSLDQPEQSMFEQLQRDQIAPPILVNEIFRSSGEMMKTSPVKTLFAAPYCKKNTSLDLGIMKAVYSDQNIMLTAMNGELIDLWDFIENEYEQRHWQEIIDIVYACSREHAIRVFAEKYPQQTVQAQAKLLTIQAVILVGEG